MSTPKSAQQEASLSLLLYLVEHTHAFLGRAGEHALVLRRGLLRTDTVVPQSFQIRLHLPGVGFGDEVILAKRGDDGLFYNRGGVGG